MPWLHEVILHAVFVQSSILLRLSAIWLVLCVAGYFLGSQILRACLPLVDFVISAIQSDFAPSLDVVGARGTAELRMSAILLRDVPLDHTRYLETARHVDYTTMDVFHVLVPPVILLAVLCAWNVYTLKDLLIRVLSGALALPTVLAMTTALTLAGRFKMWLIEATASGPFPMQEDWLIQWVLFNELGGRWLIPIAVGIACVAARRS